MIGRKKLSTIREELERAAASIGDDPIRRLEERMTASKHKGAADSGSHEVLQSLRRFLEATEKPSRPRKRTGGTKVGRSSRK